MEQGSCHFYQAPKATAAHTCLMSQVFGFQCAFCPSCEAASQRMMKDVNEEGSSTEDDSGGPT